MRPHFYFNMLVKGLVRNDLIHHWLLWGSKLDMKKPTMARASSQSRITGCLASTLQTVVSCKEPVTLSSTLSTAVGATYLSTTVLTLNTSLQRSPSLHTIKKSFSTNLRLPRSRKVTVCENELNGGRVRRWGRPIYIKTVVESLAESRPLTVTQNTDEQTADVSGVMSLQKSKLEELLLTDCAAAIVETDFSFSSSPFLSKVATGGYHDWNGSHHCDDWALGSQLYK